ncbi:hypothetical protein [Pseudomonas sp. BN411]|uniref:hypothetical protein n=1 Tax=Pseudomonas sp. BN411 TaxID=2567887 RepID=UPI002458DAF1|nr:hypothetical protein [Pseudomonas sp. BN411]MDH4564251.1 integrase [Pseudomonas sp. BN411]
MKISERNSYQVDFQLVDLDECQRIVAARPIEELILQCTSDRRIDIGSACYSDRRANSRKIPKPVTEASLRHERCIGFRAWCIDQITSFYTGASGYTVYGKATEIIGFVDWCDEHGFEYFLTSAPAYKLALNSYTQHLLAAMKIEGGVKPFTANRLQSEVLRSGPVFFPATTVNFHEDLIIISNDGSVKESTETPSEQEISEHLTPCQYLFDGITDFLLNQIEFPHRIPFMTGEARLLPAEYTITTDVIHELTPKINTNIFWDYKVGKVNSLAECMQKTKQLPHQVIRQRNEALDIFERANNDPRHPKRIWLAKLAQDAFLSLFVANSGLNETEVRDLPWGDSYSVRNSINVGFQYIKIRAAGREGEVEIQKIFIKKFKKFLKLRDYICDGKPHPYLFVNISKNNISEKPIKAVTIGNFSMQIRSFLDPGFTGLSYRKLRKYKSVYLLSKNHSIDLVSALMQSSGSTITKHYADAEEKKAIDEISTMLAQLMELLDSKAVMSTPAGDCAGVDNPSSAITPPEAYEPNCRNFVGCLFCTEFRLHANRESIRKLLSMSYVTKEYLSACTDANQFQNVHGEAINQINRILEELVNTRPEMGRVVESIRDEIEQQYKLTSYWERIYERLIKLKVLK